MRKTMMALSLSLAASAAFAAGGALPASVRGQVQNLRAQLKQDQATLSAGRKEARLERQALLVRQKEDIAKIKAGPGGRAEKKEARLAVRRKYAALLKEARTKRQEKSRRLREEMKGKKSQILRLRAAP